MLNYISEIKLAKMIFRLCAEYGPNAETYYPCPKLMNAWLVNNSPIYGPFPIQSGFRGFPIFLLDVLLLAVVVGECSHISFEAALFRDGLMSWPLKYANAVKEGKGTCTQLSLKLIH